MEKDLVRFDSPALEKSALGRALEKTGSKIVSKCISKSKIVLLLDISGSMGERLQNGEVKLEVLRREVSSFLSDMEVWTFSSNFQTNSSIPPFAGGGTAMHLPLFALGGRSVILVTDGLPDSESAAIHAAAQIERLSIIYIGDPNSDAESFLRQLAEAAGGTFDTASLSSHRQLEIKIAGLLPGGAY